MRITQCIHYGMLGGKNQWNMKVQEKKATVNGHLIGIGMYVIMISHSNTGRMI